MPKRKSNAGRPSIDTPELRQKIYDIVKQTGNLNTAARVLGKSDETFRLWTENKPDFLAMCREAQGFWELSQVRKVEEEKGGARWLLRNRIPQDYREEIAVTLESQGTLTITDETGKEEALDV